MMSTSPVLTPPDVPRPLFVDVTVSADLGVPLVCPSSVTIPPTSDATPEFQCTFSDDPFAVYTSAVCTFGDGQSAAVMPECSSTSGSDVGEVGGGDLRRLAESSCGNTDTNAVILDPVPVEGVITVPAHTYAVRNAYTITCSIVDARGTTTSRNIRVVYQRNLPPTLDCAGTVTTIAGAFDNNVVTASLMVSCRVSDTLDDTLKSVAFAAGAPATVPSLTAPTLVNGQGLLEFTAVYAITDLSSLSFVAAVTVFDSRNAFARRTLNVVVDAGTLVQDSDGDGVPDADDRTCEGVWCV